MESVLQSQKMRMWPRTETGKNVEVTHANSSFKNEKEEKSRNIVWYREKLQDTRPIVFFLALPIKIRNNDSPRGWRKGGSQRLGQLSPLPKVTFIAQRPNGELLQNVKKAQVLRVG